MPLVSVHTYKNSAVLLSATIIGPSTVQLATENYSVEGTFSNGTTATIPATWAVTAGGSFISVDSNGIVTNNHTTDGFIKNATLQATVAGGIVVTKALLVTQRPDPFFSNNVMMFPCDTVIPLVSTTITGNSTLNLNEVHDYNVQGTLLDGRVGSMDPHTTWQITAGGSFASINSSSGVVTVVPFFEGVGSITIQATTTFLNGNTVTSTRTITVYGVQDSFMLSGDVIVGVDNFFASNQLLLSGDQ